MIPLFSCKTDKSRQLRIKWNRQAWSHTDFQCESKTLKPFKKKESCQWIFERNYYSSCQARPVRMTGKYPEIPADKTSAATSSGAPWSNWWVHVVSRPWLSLVVFWATVASLCLQPCLQLFWPLNPEINKTFFSSQLLLTGYFLFWGPFSVCKPPRWLCEKIPVDQ